MTVVRSRRNLDYSQTRIPQYELDFRLSTRLGEFEMAMLEGLKAFWKCNTSEAIRRCIVYTFSKMVAGVEKFDEESIENALQLALEIYSKIKQNDQKTAATSNRRHLS